jgi:holin-like protein
LRKDHLYHWAFQKQERSAMLSRSASSQMIFRPAILEGPRMVEAFCTLLGFELLGELIRGVLHLPLPGPVAGMLLLTIWLVWRGRGIQPGIAPAAPLDQTAGALLEYMGLLFVPAGVGIIAEASLLRQEWLPIMAGIIGSTVLSLVVTGLVMHHLLRQPETRTSATAPTGHRRGIAR